MTDIKQKKDNVKMHLKDLRQNLKKMHLEVTEELILPQPEDVKELIKNEKKSLITFLFLIATLAYFYPVIKHTKNKLNCEATAKDYIIKNKNIKRINNRQLKMLSTNFCYGGEEIYEIENLRN